MKLLMPFSGWFRGIYLLLPLERRMWFITKEWWISQDSTRLYMAVTERPAWSRQCRVRSWKCEIQSPLKLIPELLLNSPEPSFPPKNPYVYFSSLELCFNSNVFPMGLEIEKKRMGSEGVWEREESKLPSPIIFMGRRSWLYFRCPYVPFFLYLSLFQVSAFQSKGAHRQPNALAW